MFNYFKTKILKRIIISLLIFILSFSFFISASNAVGGPPPEPAVIAVPSRLLNTAKKIGSDIKHWAKEKALKDLEDSLKKIGMVSIMNAVDHFAANSARDIAKGIVSGGKGQKPLILSDPEAYIGQQVDEAASVFVQDIIGKNWELGGLNLCDPSLSLKLAITGGLINMEYPPKPRCTFKKMRENWSREINDPNFLENFQPYFEPEQNDLGAALYVFGKYYQTKAEAEKYATNEHNRRGFYLDKLAGVGNTRLSDNFKGVYADRLYGEFNKEWNKGTGNDKVHIFNTPYGDVFQTPGRVAQSYLKKKNITMSADDVKKFNAMSKEEQEKAFHDKIIASSNTPEWSDVIIHVINTFTGTLINELINKAFTSGLWNKSDIRKASHKAISLGSDLYQYEAGQPYTGKKGADIYYSKVYQTKFHSTEKYDILTKLASCPNPNKAGPTECVITDKFRQAIAKRLTVEQAIKQGLLNKDFTFGYEGVNKEPSYISGYPYRSMIILRKYRIIPVGWEIAAKYINEHKISESGGKVYTLGDMVNCFSSQDDLKGLNEKWCRGLVDPNWVLLAPQHYCAKQGYGPIISKQIILGVDANKDGDYNDEGDSRPKVMIDRDNNYCADEQSCIKRGKDKNCEYYGYCVEDRRTWDFNGTSCEPKYNTCQTFRSRKNKIVSYLKNTLDFDGCDADSVGCLPYCDDPVYDVASSSIDWATSTSKCVSSWSGSDKMYFNKNVNDCNSDEEGCSQFIRTKEGLGTNLVKNSSFEAEDFIGAGWSDDYTTTEEDSYDGSRSVKATTSLSYHIDFSPLTSLINKALTLSFYAKNCSGIGYGIISADKNVPENNDHWQRFKTTKIIMDNTKVVDFSINGSGSSNCLIDAVQLEFGLQASPYNDYFSRKNVVYEKKMPNYLSKVCCKDFDKGNYTLKDNAPDVCHQFARQCSEDEAGCDLYTSQTTDVTIPAKITAGADYCPSECVGYDAFVQAPTAFETEKDKYFIPRTAKSCNLSSVGCDQFTNLDEKAKGGEGIEYYSYLRKCEKPNPKCANYYLWQGRGESGYQLKTYRLIASDVVDDSAPKTTDNEASNCNYDPVHNPDCREFYDKSGKIYYRNYSKTISCDENCHPYRRTKLGEDSEENDCTSTGGNWSSTEGCIYQAIPGQGIKCSASQVGCRKYKGTMSNNIFEVLNDDFEDGDAIGWQKSNGSAPNVVKNSLFKNGYSMEVEANSETSSSLAGLIKPNTTYELEFVANIDNLPGSNFSIKNGKSDIVGTFGTNQKDNGRQIGGNLYLYKFATSTKNNVIGDERFVINNNNSSPVDFDFIIIRELTDTYYLIKNSWQTPVSCDNLITDPNGQDCGGSEINPNVCSPQEMLFCDKYKDRDNKTHYLKSFTSLCDESAVGCELMVDTHNYSDYKGKIWTDKGNVEVSPDSYTFWVYDKKYQCNQSSKGCQVLGYPDLNRDLLPENFSSIYLINDPDKYDSILCSKDKVRCEEYTTNNGTYYFKDPGKAVCYYGQPKANATTTYSSSWYKVYNKCAGGDNRGKECTTNSDCPNSYCNIESCDLAGEGDLSVNPPLSFGTGGIKVDQPKPAYIGGKVGLCPSGQSGCVEYIDLYAKPSIEHKNKKIDLDHWTLYNASSTDNNFIDNNNCKLSSGDKIDKNKDIIYLDKSNRATTTPTKYFYIASSSISCDLSETNDNDTVKKAIVGYQLSDTVDKQSCNGVVNFGKGCVLFDKRDVVGGNKDHSNYSDLIYNTGLTYENDGIETPQSCDGKPPCDSNILLKVQPDRVCNKWLSCKSSVATKLADGKIEKDCFDIVTCNHLGSEGQCDSNIFEVNPKPELYDSSMLNRTGYSKIEYGYCENDVNKLCTDNTDCGGKNCIFDYFKSYYPLGEMKQAGGAINVPNGNFEIEGNNNYPIGWQAVEDKAWTPDKFKVIDNPYAAEQEGLNKYAPEGRNFLKFSPSKGRLESEFIEVMPNRTYVLSYYINTINFKALKGDWDEMQAIINTVSYDKDGNRLEGSVDNKGTWYCDGDTSEHAKFYDCNFGQPIGKNWEKRVHYFKTGSNPKTGSSTEKIKLMLNGQTWFGPLVWCHNDNNPDKDHYERASFSCNEGGNPKHIELCANSNCYEPGDFPAPPEKLTATSCPVSDIHIPKNACSGNFYLDDIKIRPALEIYKLGTHSNYIPQTCRLYPQSDSLSCKYIDDAKIKRNGWPGYCLEYDRAPGDHNNCLMWYPIDRVRGDGIEEGAGYADRFPLYYTIEAKKSPKEYDVASKPFWVKMQGANCMKFGRKDLGIEDANKRYYNKDAIDEIYFYCKSRRDDKHAGDDEFTLRSDSSGDSNFPPLLGGGNIKGPWWIEAYEKIKRDNGKLAKAGFDSDNCGGSGGCEYNCAKFYAVFDENGYFDHLRVYTFDDSNDSSSWDCTAHFKYHLNYASKIAMVVTATGQNKFWSSKVYEGSSYIVPNLGYSYNSDYKPFGAIVPPKPVTNPYEWDSREEVGIQPLYVESPDKKNYKEPWQARAGSPYSCNGDCGKFLIVPGMLPSETDAVNRVKRLFAQSYGSWNWALEWKCSNGDIPANGSTDFCNQYCVNGSCEKSTEKRCSSNGNICETDTSDQTCKNCSLRGEDGYKCDDGDLCCPKAGDCKPVYKCNKGEKAGDQCKPDHNDCPNGSCVSYSRYKKIESDNWSPPEEICDSLTRPNYSSICGYCYRGDPPKSKGECNGSNFNNTCNNCPGPTCDYCGIPPEVSNIMLDKIGKKKSPLKITDLKLVNLTFNTKVDAEQLPLVEYTVDWGDGSTTTISGIEMRDKQVLDNPHSLYHLYSYDEMKAKKGNGINIECSTDTKNGKDYYYCIATPKILIRDNWGWCSYPDSYPDNEKKRLDCNHWKSGPSVKVFKDYKVALAPSPTVCAPDGCNGNCPSGCSVAQDPDCGTNGCCGDGTCDSGEDSSSCPPDCGGGSCTSVGNNIVITNNSYSGDLDSNNDGTGYPEADSICATECGSAFHTCTPSELLPLQGTACSGSIIVRMINGGNGLDYDCSNWTSSSHSVTGLAAQCYHNKWAYIDANSNGNYSLWCDYDKPFFCCSSGGACTDECSSPSTGCHGNWTWSCAKHADGCWYKDNQTDCSASGKTCSAGTCIAGSGGIGSIQGNVNLIRNFPIAKSNGNNSVKLALAKNLDKKNKVNSKGKVLGVQEKKNISKNTNPFFQDKLSVEPSSFPENSFLTIKFVSKLAYQDIFEIKTSIRDKKNNQIIKVYNNKKYFALYNNGKHNDNLKNDHNWATVIDTAKLNLAQGEYQIDLSVIPLKGEEKSFSTTFEIKNPAKLIKGKDYLDDQLVVKFFPHTFEMPFDLSEVKVDSKDFQKLTIPDSVDKLIKNFKVTKIKRAFTLSKKEIKEYKENPTVVKERYNIYTFVFNKDIDINALKQVFQKDKNIIYADFNGKIHLSYIPSNEYYNKNFNTSTHTQCEFSYQDPLYSNGENRTIAGQWGLKRIGMEKAWDIFHNYSITPKVLLVDASLSDHWSGHATHMRGTITSYRSLSCQGVPDETAGIIDRSNVVDASITIDTDMVATINAMYDYLITNGHYNNINVINMSWGYSNFNQDCDDMLQEIYNKGIILVAAAGNNTNGSITNIDYPAASDYVMAVSASTPEDEVASFSQTKKWTATGIEVAAPGTYIISDRYKNADNYYGLDSPSPGSDSCLDWPTDCSIIFKGGDSMSSAMTSGVAGLIYSVGGFTSKTKQTSDRVRKIIKFTSDDIENNNIYGVIDSKAGYGRINAERALTFLKNGKIGIKSIVALYKNVSDFNSPGFDNDCSDGLCYVVSDAKTGSYNLSNIPNGTYKIVSWIVDYENSNVDTVLPGLPFPGDNFFCSMPQDITISGNTQKDFDFDIDDL